jgi:hypothetical protein
MITQKLRKQIRERDKGRCRECGLKVGKDTGLEGHVHHIIPKSCGGQDTLENLITLCLLCHATKIKHRQVITRGKKLGPQFLKWALWEIGLNLTYSAFCINAKDFPKYKIAATLESAIAALESLQPWITDIDFDGDLQLMPKLEELFESIKIAHISHDTQRTLDEIINQSQSS